MKQEYVLVYNGVSYDYYKSESDARKAAEELISKCGGTAECYLMNDECESWEDGQWIFCYDETLND